MQEIDPFFEHVRSIMIEVMAVLHANGYKELHVGGMMRLIGVADYTAKDHDHARIEIDAALVQQLAAELRLQGTPPGVTVH